MFPFLLRIVIPAVVIALVAEVSRRSPRAGGLLLTLPIVSILAFTAAWIKDHDLPAISKLARETLILVPPGLPFFLPLAFADRLTIGFWQALVAGLLLASMTIGVWLIYGPK
jgi:hypothetical protein